MLARWIDQSKLTVGMSVSGCFYVSTTDCLSPISRNGKWMDRWIVFSKYTYSCFAY